MIHESRDVLIASSLKYEGQWHLMYRAMCRREFPEEYYFNKIDRIKSKVVTILDPDYPSFMKSIPHPPLVLYYYGDLSIMNDYYRNISIVGSRKCSRYGVEITKRITKGLVDHGFVIVSGLASGIDGVAHRTCIESGGKTIAILGCGIERCYPLDNQDIYDEIRAKHLLISEYPGYTNPDSAHFPIRNRLIAGISKTVILTEAAPMSGSLVTAGLALAMNADVMCVPQKAGFNSECNRLIMNGAFLIENAEDVISQMSQF